MSNFICKTAVELLQNIGSNTDLQLNTGDYDISDIVLPYDKDVYYADIGVGPYGDRELIIRNLSYASLTGNSGTRIINKYVYANVVTLINCNNISLKNIEFGHYPEMGGCRGGVLVLLNCTNVTIDNCSMFGCGTIGISMIGCQSIQLIYLEDTTECRFQDTRIQQNETRSIRILHCNDIVFDTCFIGENQVSEWSSVDSPLFEIGNSSGDVIVKSSHIDIPSDCLVNERERLTIDNCRITNDFVYG